MNKSKIDWCGYTWNPVTGCLHNCPYCYARTIANRFGTSGEDWVDTFTGYPMPGTKGLNSIILFHPFCKNGAIQPYPIKFKPTFHKYRLQEPIKKTKGENIFVCSMADLFGEWVPDRWIEDIWDACGRALQHNYLFLTKNPKRINKVLDYYMVEDRGSSDGYEFFKKFWFGTTITGQKDIERLADISSIEEGNRFLSIEPLHSRITLNLPKMRCPICGSSHVYQENPILSIENNWYCDDCGEWEGKDNTELKPNIDWVIIGAETGNRKEKIVPDRCWIEDIVNECKSVGVPVFMKSNLSGIWGEELIQEWPEALRYSTT